MTEINNRIKLSFITLLIISLLGGCSAGSVVEVNSDNSKQAGDISDNNQDVRLIENQEENDSPNMIEPDNISNNAQDVELIESQKEKIAPEVIETGDNISDDPQGSEIEQNQQETINLDSAADVEANLPNQQEEVGNDQVRHETRAIWSWVGRKHQPGNEKVTRQDVDRLVAKVDAANLNVILLSVYKEGAVYFEPNHTRFPDGSQRLSNQSDFVKDGDEYSDALSYLLAIRDERRSDEDPFNDFEVHAWFNVHKGGAISKENSWSDETQPYMLHALFPEFKLKTGNYYVKGGGEFIRHDVSVVHQPRFRAYMSDLIAGLAEDYNVDGVHLDNIRTGGICFNNDSLDYPGTEYDYPGCQEAYKAWTLETYGHKYTLWDDTDGNKKIRDGESGRVAAWQERGVGMLVQSIHDEVKSVRPDIIISVAASGRNVPPEVRRNSIQGRVPWVWLDQGWIDAAFLMTYTSDTEWIIDQVHQVRDATENERSRSRVFPGLITYNPGNAREQWIYLVEEQVNALMREQWTGHTLEPAAGGTAFYLDRRMGDEVVEALANGPFKDPAVPFWGE